VAAERIILFVRLEKIERSFKFSLNFQNYERDPLSPPEGEAAQGENPLTPAIALIFMDGAAHTTVIVKGRDVDSQDYFYSDVTR